MSLFKYKTTTKEGGTKEGQIEAATFDIAIDALQKRGLVVISLDPIKKKIGLFEKELFSLEKIKKVDIVIFSRQIATLFEAKVPALTSFELLASEAEKPVLRNKLLEIVEDVKGGLKISDAFAKHPRIFSSFYVNMVKSGEESGKLEEVFQFLADYLERSYDLSSKARRAFIYPAFVLTAFLVIVVLMLVVVVPQLIGIIEESGQDVPFYTDVVIFSSNFLKSYGIFALLILVGIIAFGWRYIKTKAGKISFSRAQINFPFLGELYRKIYLSRMADNLETLFSGGVGVLRSLQITSDVIDNLVYKNILEKTSEKVKGGASIAESLSQFEEIPGFTSQMIRIGEETGKLDFILKTLARFYRKEVDQALETLVSMLEPIMTVVLGLFVGLLLASVLIPIYNIAMSV